MADGNGYVIGRYLLDTLTIGMYDNPLCILREYVQNAADAIDEAVKAGDLDEDEPEISISIDPQNGSIVIQDNGAGICTAHARRKLLSVGGSDKMGVRQRGFRGIGRLGGVAYSDTLIFRTKAYGEADESICTWDSRTVRQLLSPSNSQARGFSITDLIGQCVTVEKRRAEGSAKNGYFIVEMSGVRCAKNVLVDLQEVRAYLEQVAPIPFNTLKFRYGKDLEEYLTRSVSNYTTYRILLNDDELLKPYTQTITIRKRETDQITDIEKFDICDRGDHRIAVGWRGVRKSNTAQISGQSMMDGFRVRVGNILLGDGHLLDAHFPEGRFNRYNIGEIHVTDPGLLPNARRDNFEDGDLRADFYESVQRILGSRLTKDIRDASRKKADVKPITESKDLVVNIQKQVKEGGFHTERQKEDAAKDLRCRKDQLEKLLNKRGASPEVKKEAEKVSRQVQNVLDTIESADMTVETALKDQFSRPQRELIQAVLDQVYHLYLKAPTREKLVERVINALRQRP